MIVEATVAARERSGTPDDTVTIPWGCRETTEATGQRPATRTV